MEEPRATLGVKAGKICHRFIDSHHKEPNERTNRTRNPTYKRTNRGEETVRDNRVHTRVCVRV